MEYTRCGFNHYRTSTLVANLVGLYIMLDSDHWQYFGYLLFYRSPILLEQKVFGKQVASRIAKRCIRKRHSQNTLEDLKSNPKSTYPVRKNGLLGELTAGIAHEIQNPLNFVNNFAELNTELGQRNDEQLAIGNEQYAKGNPQQAIAHLQQAKGSDQ
ncbi:MAG: hypothetical protein IPP42_01545 [Saprospiraceae bacterium]|nr:hypothetical protein [Saprospiraceae bacterium]